MVVSSWFEASPPMRCKPVETTGGASSIGWGEGLNQAIEEGSLGTHDPPPGVLDLHPFGPVDFGEPLDPSRMRGHSISN